MLANRTIGLYSCKYERVNMSKMSIYKQELLLN